MFSFLMVRFVCLLFMLFACFGGAFCFFVWMGGCLPFV